MLRMAAVAVGAGRIAIGAPLLVRPTVAQLWIGRDASTRGAQALTRGFAGRDVVLGAGVLAAVAGGRDVAPWLAAGAAADTVDLVATAVAGDALTARPRIATIAAAGVAALTGFALAAASEG